MALSSTTRLSTIYKERVRTIMPRVAIVVHRHAPLEPSNYWLRAIADCWRDRGIQVELIDAPHIRLKADLAILHVDLTKVPRSYIDCVGKLPATINGQVADISKRAISQNLLRRGDRYAGPVIIKTDLNCGGRPESGIAFRSWHARKLDGLLSASLGYLEQRYRRSRRIRRHGSVNAFQDYPVLESIALVPDKVWSDTELVVERFLPEQVNGLYCVRTWLFFGDQDRLTMFFSRDPVIKSHNIVSFERLSEVPPELRRMREALKFDYGKFDYTMVDGRPMLFDANRTPTFGDFPKERYMPLAQSLARGIDSWL
jgi:hypothetical protein